MTTFSQEGVVLIASSLPLTPHPRRRRICCFAQTYCRPTSFYSGLCSPPLLSQIGKVMCTFFVHRGGPTGGHRWWSNILQGTCLLRQRGKVLCSDAK